MNLSEAFATYLQDLGVATIGQTLFIGKAPSTLKAVDSLWWIIESGGSTTQNNSTGEKIKSHNIEIYNSSTDYKSVYDALSNLSILIDNDSCSQLQGYETIDINTNTYPIDNDVDSEGRKIGMLQVTLTTYL